MKNELMNNNHDKAVNSQNNLLELDIKKKDKKKLKDQKKAKKKKKAKKAKFLNLESKKFYRVSESEGSSKIPKKVYEKQLARLQLELVKMQYWVKHTGTRIVILFEGRDAAGKGGTIKRITEPLNPRGCRVVALGTPSDREKTEWYYQRYVAHLPAAGEIVCFDRSWYNRAGVEKVMGFCTDRQYKEFMKACPEFERMLVRSGIILLKYWFSVSDEEQERRFQSRTIDPARRWKLSPMDLESRDRWAEYSQAKDAMFTHTNIPEAPWFTVEADDKKRARLNCISHLLSKIPYVDMTPEPIELPKRKSLPKDYTRTPFNEQFFVPDWELVDLEHKKN
ncbi:polyphosphate kinase 2, PA0141 family [Xenococcus sp. PCC 7305]|uniref:polyphosphate kinase 2 n=1 Tax=Xenococcus sp. PCC 7305 TaxID=102125 RepID=UPI0002ABA148|nr:polyphosphate kinase 2 [Xenococcus sp. PCC 7305]ELS03350.1 polyphosphate kinase 2, PA0141 family [Xenococcus sp. PCC 7305]